MAARKTNRATSKPISSKIKSAVVGRAKSVVNRMKAIPKNIKEVPKNIKAVPKTLSKKVKEIPKNIKAIPKNIKAIPKNIKAIPKNIKANLGSIGTKKHTTKPKAQSKSVESKKPKETTPHAVNNRRRSTGRSTGYFNRQRSTKYFK